MRNLLVLCVVGFALGLRSAPPALAQITAPFIVTQNPPVLFLSAGEAVVLLADAAGTQPFTYVWKKNGTVLAGEGFSFLLFTASASTAGVYTVTVSNSAGSATTAPTQVIVSPSTKFVSQPQSQVVPGGANAIFSVVISGTTPDSYRWTKDGQAIPGSNSPSIMISNAGPEDAGTYTALLSFPGSSMSSIPASLTVVGSPSPGGKPARLLNLSTRAQVGKDADVLISGLIIDGTLPKKILIRALGPALDKYGVQDTLTNPSIKIVAGNGSTVASNDDWGTPAQNQNEVLFASNETGAPPLPAGGKDAALVAELQPGAYTAVVSGVGNTTGVALLEVWDIAYLTPNKLVNISSRAFVGPGDKVLIAGLIVSGAAPQKFLIRAVGPGLAQFNVPGLLSDPRFEIIDGANRTVATSDDWNEPATVTETRSASKTLNVFTLAEGSKDAARVVELTPGGYTVLVRGTGESTGVALVEVYTIP